MRRFFAKLKDERGATSVEYGLILALIFLAMIGAVSAFGQTTIDMWNMVSNKVTGA
jgi:pilus assembly protein Flp/PilA